MAIKVGNNGPLIKSIKVGVPNTVVKRVTVGPPTNVTAGSGERTIHNLTGVNTSGRTHGSLLVYDSTSGVDGEYRNTIFTADSNKLTITHNHTNDTLKIALGDSTGKIPGHFIPSLDSTYNLGSLTHKWKDLHLSGSTINLGGLLLKNVGGQLKATDSAGTVAPLDLSKSVTEIRNMFSAGGDLTYDSEAGRYSIDVEQIYTKSNFDSDFNLALDSAIFEGVGLTYNNATNTLDIDSAELYSFFKHDNFGDFVANEHIDHTGVSIIAGTGLSGGGTIATNRTINIANTGVDSGTYGSATSVPRFTVNARGQIDSVGELTIAGVTGITYDSSSGLITISTTGGSFTDSINLNAFTTANLSENTNLYYTDTRARAAVSGNKGLAYNSSTGVMDVDSANIRGMLSGGTGITYNSGTGAITTTDADIVHDNLSGFVADEHVAHSGVSITAGTGLKGGGTIASTRDLAIDSAELLSLYNSSIVHDNLSGFVADEHVAHGGVSITAGTGLKGGGTIASTRDLAIDSAELLSLYEPSLRHDNLSGFVANEHVDHSSVSITAGAGLSGGGTIASTRDLAIDSAELYSLYKHDNFSDFVADEHVAHGSVSIIAGKGLSGGGTIASNRTIDVDSANLVILARTALSGTNGISYTSGTGVIRAPQPLDSNATPTFKQLRGPAELVIDPAAIGDATGTVKILGNLQVEGTQTTINSTAISLNDKTIVIADSSADSSALNGAGIVWGGDSVVDNPTFTYAHSGAKFVANREISATTLTGAIAASQLTGTIDSARIPALATSDITSGTIDSARIPTLLIGDIGNINAINHDTLTGFVADEHVAHAGVSVIAGKGLSGGGTIASSRTLDVDSANIISFTRALPTNVHATFGNDSDFTIHHDGTNSIMRDVNGHNVWLQTDGHIILSKKNAAEYYAIFYDDAGVELRYNNVKRFETDNYGIDVTGRVFADSLNAGGNIRADGGYLIMGDAAYSASTGYVGMKSFAMSGTSDYMILSGGSTTDGNTYVSAKSGSNVRIRGGGNASTHQLEISSTQARAAGDFAFDSSGAILFDKSDQALEFGDNYKATFGAGTDLKIYHNGSHSIIEDAGTGSLQLRSNNFTVQNAAGAENQLTALSGGAVTLYHNNNAKLTTTTTGTTITGTMNADSATVYKLSADSSITIDAGSTTGAGLYIKGTSTNGSNFGPNIFLNRDPSDNSRSDWDYLGALYFRGEDNAGNMTSYSVLVGRIAETQNGYETGRTEIYGMYNGSWTRSYVLAPDKLALTTEQTLQWTDHKGTSYECTLDWATPSAARTVTFPDATGTAITTGNLSDITDIGTLAPSSGDVIITSTDGGQWRDPRLILYRNSGSPANNDYIGNVTIQGRNDNSQDVVYGTMVGQIRDKSDGSEEGAIVFTASKSGATTNVLRLNIDSENISPLDINILKYETPKLKLGITDTTIVDGNELGAIEFSAPDEASGTDAITTAASIVAEADATFSSSANNTDLVFKLGTSGAATEKARLTHEGGFSATSFSGSGASLTALPAAQLTGTLDSARFPVALPAVSGANLTNLPETGDGGIAMAIALG